MRERRLVSDAPGLKDELSGYFFGMGNIGV